MDNNKSLIIWDYRDAPEGYKSLSTYGGDEDWVVYCPSVFRRRSYIPVNLAGAIEGWEDSYSDGWGHVDRHELENGDVVVIFAHA